MPAQIDLDGGSKPSYPVFVPAFHIKCGLGKIIFLCDFLHQLIAGPTLERTYRRGITGKYPVGKCIYLINLLPHTVSFLIFYPFAPGGGEFERGLGAQIEADQNTLAVRTDNLGGHSGRIGGGVAT